MIGIKHDQKKRQSKPKTNMFILASSSEVSERLHLMAFLTCGNCFLLIAIKRGISVYRIVEAQCNTVLTGNGITSYNSVELTLKISHTPVDKVCSGFIRVTTRLKKKKSSEQT